MSFVETNNGKKVSKKTEKIDEDFNIPEENDNIELDDELKSEEVEPLKPINNEKSKTKNSSNPIFGDNDSKKIEFIDEGVILSLLFIYILWRLMKSKSFSILKLFKGNMRAAGTFFLFFSQIFTVIYNVTLIYLSNFYVLDKGSIEKIGYYSGSHIIKFFDFKRKLDIVQLMNISFCLSNILKISTLFMLIGLWLPCAYSFAIKRRNNNNGGNSTIENDRENEMGVFVLNDGIGKPIKKKNEVAEALSHASIVTFAKLYAWLRIPLAIILEINHDYMSEKSIVFYRSVFYGTEIYVAVLFFLILETRFMTIMSRRENNLYSYNNIFGTRNVNPGSNEKSVVQNINFLLILLMVDGFVRYYINIIAIPVELSPLTLHILKKVAFVTEFTLIVLMTSMLCPMPSQIYDHGENDSTSNLDSNKTVNDPWNLQPRLGYNNRDDEASVSRGMTSVLGDNVNTEIIEFGDYREEIHCGK